jgi:hypothetical protein
VIRTDTTATDTTTTDTTTTDSLLAALGHVSGIGDLDRAIASRAASRRPNDQR